MDEEIFIDGKSYDVDGDGVSGEDSKVVFIAETTWQKCQDDNGCTLTPITIGGLYKYTVTFDGEVNEEGEKVATVRDTRYDKENFWSLSYMEMGKTDRMNLKKWIQTDKDENGKDYCWSLAEKRNRIGGCWNNLSTEEYKKILMDRESMDRNPKCIGKYN